MRTRRFPPRLAEASHAVLKHLVDAWRGAGSGPRRVRGSCPRGGGDRLSVSPPSLDDIAAFSGVAAEPEHKGLLPSLRSRAYGGSEALSDRRLFLVLDGNILLVGRGADSCLTVRVVQGALSLCGCCAPEEPPPASQEGEEDEDDVFGNLHDTRTTAAGYEDGIETWSVWRVGHECACGHAPRHFVHRASRAD